MRPKILAIILYHCRYQKATASALDVLSEILDIFISSLLRSCARHSHGNLFLPATEDVDLEDETNHPQIKCIGYTSTLEILRQAKPLAGSLSEILEYLYSLSRISRSSPEGLSFLEERGLIPPSPILIQPCLNSISIASSASDDKAEDLLIENSALPVD